MKVAIGSDDGKRINQHFGRAKSFYIAEVDLESESYELLEERPIEDEIHEASGNINTSCHGGSTHNDKNFKRTAFMLSDCSYLIAEKIGFAARTVLESSGIACFELPGEIDEVLAKLFVFLKRQQDIKAGKNKGGK